MKSIEILTIGLRILGVYLIAGFLVLITPISTFATFDDETSQSAYMILALGIIVYVIIIFCLIKFPYRIANLLKQKVKEDEIIFEGSAKDIVTSLSIIIGIYMLSFVIPNIAHYSMWILVDGFNFNEGKEASISLITTILQAIVGFYLTFFSFQLSSKLWSLNKKH